MVRLHRGCSWLCWGLWRRKTISTPAAHVSSDLARHMGSIELSALGIGAILGVGVFVTTGEVALLSGPSGLAAFLVAALATCLAALCFCEFVTRLPFCGSGYLFAYVVFGELVAFLVGWSLILGYTVAAANIAHAWSQRMDALTNFTISSILSEAAPIGREGFNSYFDALALVLILLITVGLMPRARFAAILNTIFAAVSLLVIAAVVISGCIHFNTENWKLKGDHSRSSAGGFAPYGLPKLIKAFCTSCLAFLGFDVLVMAAEEVRTPQVALPRSIFTSICVSAFFFIVVSVTLTLTTPFFLLPEIDPLGAFFRRIGWLPLGYIAAIGALWALASSLFAALFGLSRIIFAMAQDGLIFHCFAKVTACSRTPIAASVLSGLLAASLAGLADLDRLRELMAIGLLMAFVSVSLAVILLHGSFDLQAHRPPDHPLTELEAAQSRDGSVEALVGPFRPMFTCCKTITIRSFFYHLFLRHSQTPSPVSQRITSICGVALSALIFVIAYLVTFSPSYSCQSFIIAISVIGAVCLLLLIILQIQPQDFTVQTPQVPLVPWLPAISIFVDAYILMQFDRSSYHRFAVWLGIGLLMYFFHGIMSSRERSLKHENTMQKASKWVMESQIHGNIGLEISQVTEQTDNWREESVTQF